MKCKLCTKFYNDYPLQKDGDGGMYHLMRVEGNAKYMSSPIQCAFDNSCEFLSNNWACRTMFRLRDIAREKGFHFRDDSDAASIGVIWINGHIVGENVQMGYIVMTWYKSRGKTGHAWVVCDDRRIEKLTKETAEAVIKYYDDKSHKSAISAL